MPVVRRHASPLGVLAVILVIATTISLGASVARAMPARDPVTTGRTPSDYVAARTEPVTAAESTSEAGDANITLPLTAAVVAVAVAFAAVVLVRRNAAPSTADIR